LSENLLNPNLNNKSNNEYLFSEEGTRKHSYGDLRKTHFLEILKETKNNKSKICEYLMNLFNEASKGAKNVKKDVEIKKEEIDSMNVLQFIHRFDKYGSK